MGGHPKRPEPQLARTDFESMTHEQLAAMLESASTSGASHLSTKLSKAASTISKIGDDLMKHVKDLEWQGEGGDAFRDWGGQTAGATLRLGQYAEVASRWMGTVSQAISEAKAAMPDTSETTQAKKDLSNAHATIAAAKEPGAHNDPDAQKLAQTARTDASSAQQRIDAARGEAIQQMRKLAQTYEFSAQEVNSVPPPTFSPPAGRTGDNNWWLRDGKDHMASGSSYGNIRNPDTLTRADQSGTRTRSAHPVSPAPVMWAPSEQSSHAVRHSQPVSLDIDSADTLPRASPPQISPTVAPTGMPHSDPPSANQPMAMPPTFSNGERQFTSTPPTGMPAPGRVPQIPTAGRPTGSTPGPPRETGIVGGRPVTSGGRMSNGIPRGTVIGKENAQGRMPMGRGMSPGAPAGGAARPGSTAIGGRRLASESGGVLGGRPGQPGRNSGRPFTPGGSGLVRPPTDSSEAERGTAIGRTGAPGSRPSGTRNAQRQEGQRPDYLIEDDETWTGESRRTLPRVID
ncbi:hypothetical protein [Streptomyces sp. L2]|uniref:hypothetical protein n=1 Tax=Streptomyces sp. L2 TaxID=2162665 RepID=UPI001010F1E6|nr:hypothetical protein [Streptomyces sp. L2]